MCTRRHFARLTGGADQPLRLVLEDRPSTTQTINRNIGEHRSVTSARQGGVCVLPACGRMDRRRSFQFTLPVQTSGGHPHSLASRWAMDRPSSHAEIFSTAEGAQHD